MKVSQQYNVTCNTTHHHLLDVHQQTEPSNHLAPASVHYTKLQFLIRHQCPHTIQSLNAL